MPNDVSAAHSNAQSTRSRTPSRRRRRARSGFTGSPSRPPSPPTCYPDRRAGPRHGVEPGLPRLADLLRTLMPKMEGGVLVEHSHRLAAGAVVVLTLVLAGSLTATRDPALRRLRGFGWLAVGLVFAQALLGGITRPPAPADAHLDGAHRDVAALLHDGALPGGALQARAAGGGRAVAPGRLSPGARDGSRGLHADGVAADLVRHSGAASPASTFRSAAGRSGRTPTRRCSSRPCTG